MRRIFLLIIVGLLLVGMPMRAHSQFELHKADFYAVLGFEESAKVTAWMKQISSKMIDGYKGIEKKEYGGLNFYDYLKSEFPGFKCKHRILFHWGYNSKPWNDALQAKVDALPWGKDPQEVIRFMQCITDEQQYRNREANAMTEALFGFAKGGKDAAYANAMISIVYDTHLLGDYTPDNSDFDGVQDFRSVVGDMINAVRKLDERGAKVLVKKIQSIANNEQISIQIRAERLISMRSKEMPGFLQSAQRGSLAKRFNKQGIYFK